MLKQITNISLTLLAVFFLTATVFAQSDEQIAKKYSISFPIKELGGCTSISSCKTFCYEPKNYQSCSDFAKKHKLSNDPSESSSTNSAKSEEEILKLATVELGCSSQDACMDFCEREENMEKCMDFAARHNLMEDASQMKEKMSTVKHLLGCTSMKSCMDFCNNAANMQKCMEVFKQAGFPVEASYSGPGGCNSEQSCRAYCETNPKECGGDNFQQEPPEVWCSKVGSDCKWDGTTCTCGQVSTQEGGDVWCPKAGPGCKWTGTTCQCEEQSLGGEIPLQGTDPTEWCNQNPGKCTYQNQSDPSAECAKYGCTFDGKTCQCPSSDDKIDFSTQCLSQSGCSWDAVLKICSCQTQTTPSCPPGQIMESDGSCRPEGVSTEGGETVTESQCLAASCNWTGNTCQCPDTKGVQGTNTKRSLLQQILNFFLRL